MSDYDFASLVAQVLEATEPGDVLTYGEVAETAGRPGAARAVGTALRSSEGLPWWRVVTSTGRLVPGNEAEHEARLVAEGAVVVNGRVVAGAPASVNPAVPKPAITKPAIAKQGDEGTSG